MSSPIFHYDGNWYFWDETWTFMYGPFKSEREAELFLQEYSSKHLEGKPFKNFVLRLRIAFERITGKI